MIAAGPAPLSSLYQATGKAMDNSPLLTPLSLTEMDAMQMSLSVPLGVYVHARAGGGAP